MSDAAWVSVAIAFATFVLASAGAMVGATWTVGRQTALFATKKEMIEGERRLSDSLELGLHNCGEGIVFIRQRVTDAELWARDHLLRREDFNLFLTDLKDAKNQLARLGAVEVKVDTMWAFQIRRGMVEVVERGAGTMSSPLTFSKEALEALDPLKHALILFYKGLPKGKSDADVLLEIEAQFGEQLLEKVCLPCRLSHGACLLLAYAVAKQAPILDISI